MTPEALTELVRAIVLKELEARDAADLAKAKEAYERGQAIRAERDRLRKLIREEIANSKGKAEGEWVETRNGRTFIPSNPADAVSKDGQ